MDFTPIINELLQLWWLLPILFALAFLQSPLFKGILGELIIRLIARLTLPKTTYHPIHNVTLATADGTTQIDHLFISRFGIFVVETKNMKGWIFGSERQAQWTQKIYKKSYQFQNPIRQNYKHVKAIEETLKTPPENIHSVIVFVGDNTFKTPMPENVTRGVGYIRYIRSFNEQIYSESEVQQLISAIETLRLNPSRETHKQHLESLKKRHTLATEKSCPKCGKAMVLRTAKRGKNIGQQFWGCSDYPSCKSTQASPEKDW